MNGFPARSPEPGDYEKGLIQDLYTKLGLQDPLSKKFLAVMLTAAKVFDYKQQRYGPANIAKFGETGVMIRVSDKGERIVNLWRTGQVPTDESIEDSWGDTMVYSAIALMCRWGWWPGVKATNPPPV